MRFGQVIHKLYLFIQQLGTQIGADWRLERGVTNVIGGEIFQFFSYQKLFWYFVYLAQILALLFLRLAPSFIIIIPPRQSIQRGEFYINFTFNKEGRTCWGISSDIVHFYISDIWPDCCQSVLLQCRGCWSLSTISLYIINTFYWFSISHWNSSPHQDSPSSHTSVQLRWGKTLRSVPWLCPESWFITARSCRKWKYYC